MQRFINMDADESIFFARELEYVKTKSYDVKYADLKARTLIPVSNEAGPGAETIKYEQYDQVGMAKVLASYADDIPRADVKGKEFIGVVRGLASSYGYSLQEVRAAKQAGKPLQQRRANSAKRAIMQLENKIAFFGDANHNLKGLISHPNISSTTIPADGTGTTTTFSTKTALQIIRDLNALCNFIVENTKGVEVPDTLLLPLKQFNYISSNPWSSNSDTTIAQYFLKNSPYIKKLDWVNELSGAGASGSDRMLAYRKDPDALTLEVPQDFEQLEVEPRNLEYVVNCHARTGGCLVYYPLSVCYADGI